MNLQEIKAEKERKVSDIIAECGMFFAFSNEQFDENKTPLKEGEKYARLGAGAFIPKSKLDQYLGSMEGLNKWYKDTVKSNKLRRENIIYELSNHEAWYSYDIEDTLNALGSDYTEAEVMEVFRAEYNKQMELRD